MGAVRSKIALFIAGALSVVTILAVLVAVGVVPVKVHEKTVVERTAVASGLGSADAADTTLASGKGTLTAAQIYQKYATGVVEVLATFTGSNDGFYGPQQPTESQALGSGFVVSEAGHILTNAHVVAEGGVRAESVQVVLRVSDTDTKKVSATIVGVDESSDVALLKVDPTKAGSLTPLTLGDSDEVQVGESVVAIGNPLGYDFSLTEGVVSAVDRTLQSPNGSVISNGIQTDAAINSGNSGGPLFNAHGEVIGINEQIVSQSGGSQGLGFAVPINTAADVMAQLKENGTVTYAWLGIQGQTLTSDVAEALGLTRVDGVLVVQVTPDSPASKAGLRGGSDQASLQGEVYVLGGDIVTAIDGVEVQTMEDLMAEITSHEPGDAVALTLVRDGDTTKAEARLTARPEGL